MQSFYSISIPNNIFLHIILNLYQQCRTQFYTANSVTVWAEKNFSNSFPNKMYRLQICLLHYKFFNKISQKILHSHTCKDREKKSFNLGLIKRSHPLDKAVFEFLIVILFISWGLSPFFLTTAEVYVRWTFELLFHKI